MADYYPGVPALEGTVNTEPFSVSEIADFIIAESESPVEIAIEGTEIVIQNTETEEWVLTGVGCTDLENTTYWLDIGGTTGTVTNEPLGLYNDPMKLEPGILIGANIAVKYYAKVDEDAPAAQSYVGKILGYIKP